MLPRLTYLLTTYNRKDFISESFRSALNQDYDGGLEIIVSDDCSTDGTYDILRDMAAGYTGRHKVVVTQTPRNGRLSCNTNHAMQFASSDWIVRADDDDLSSPDRCSILAAAIQRFPDATAFAQSYKVVRDRSELTQKALADRNRPISFCRLGWDELSTRPYLNFAQTGYMYKAWSRRVYSEFPPLPADSYFMDDYFAYMRALAIGDCIMIDSAPVVLAYWGADNSSGDKSSSRTLESIKRKELYQQEYLRVSTHAMELLVEELECHFRGHGNQQASEILIPVLTREWEIDRIWNGFWQETFLGRFRRLVRLLHFERPSLYHWSKLLPLNLFCRLIRIIKTLRARLWP